jgi:hypothetical protein
MEGLLVVACGNGEGGSPGGESRISQEVAAIHIISLE